MAKIRKDEKKSPPPISTASLPDIVFMLLFFFMVSTTMRTNEPMVNVQLPKATEVKKLEKRNLVDYVYVGPPKRKYQGDLGTEPRVQLSDQIADINEIQQFIASSRATRTEDEVSYMTTVLKVDQDVRMGIITDVKQELRKANALKINYSTIKVKAK